MVTPSADLINSGTNHDVHRQIALPFSKWLYRLSPLTKTPINSVWYDAILAIIMGLLAFAGDQAINACFALSVAGLYVAYTIPIAARFYGGSTFSPGPFYLGFLVSGLPVSSISYRGLIEGSFRARHAQQCLSSSWGS